MDEWSVGTDGPWWRLIAGMLQTCPGAGCGCGGARSPENTQTRSLQYASCPVSSEGEPLTVGRAGRLNDQIIIAVKVCFERQDCVDV